MLNFYKRLFLTPDDIGIKKYAVDEIAERMKRIEDVDQSSLMEFALTLQKLWDDTNVEDENICKNLANSST